VPAAKLKAVLVSEIVLEILWTKEMRARRGDEAIELTATDFALLAAMAAKPGASSPCRSCST
jgi:DNA-binding response OmpR family regulator